MIVIVNATDDCDCKCFDQLNTGEIYANMNKLSSNLTAFRINLFINLKDS